MLWRPTLGRLHWDRPALPYLVLLASPALSLLVGWIILLSIPECGEDEPWWELRYVEIALLPALADLLPFLWLLSRTPRVRSAAAVAGFLGSVRYAIPQAAMLLSSMSSRGQEMNSDCTISIFFVVLVLVPGILMLWIVSAVVAAVILVRSRRT